MSTSRVFDVVIIGAGIAGASLAARLAPHRRVLLLEQEAQPGYHATGRSAALYSALYGNSVIASLTRASRAFFEQPPRGLAEHPLLSPRGVLYVGGGEAQSRLLELCTSPLATAVSAAEAQRRVPVLRQDAAASAVLEPDACDIDVHALHQGFLRLAKAAGATLRCQARVEHLAPRPRWEISTTAGDYQAEILVNAAGAWADGLAAMAGLSRLGIQPLRRTALLVDAVQAASSAHWPAVIAADESYYFKPDAGWLLLSPADETPSDPCDAQPEELDVAIAIDRVEAATTLGIRRVLRRWAGLRSFAPDRTPVVGFDPRQAGFFWLAGQGGYGVQTAPALSEAAAALLLQDRLPAALTDAGLTATPLHPARLILRAGQQAA